MHGAQYEGYEEICNLFRHILSYSFVYFLHEDTADLLTVRLIFYFVNIYVLY